ncbi:hypothetical protein [Leptolyngbya sp. FACHB-261]|uniref:hypothetical protein n=1 Tax=Leptolyngbya sp. FACHB-261 TaxID=2692806 RepID=UPI0016857C13|nr:hypothetical protein [Leptolyngbya sp. FACHB-261]
MISSNMTSYAEIPQPSVVAEQIYKQAEFEFKYVLETQRWYRNANVASNANSDATEETNEPTWLHAPRMEVLYFIQTQLNEMLNPIGGYNLHYLQQVYTLLKLHYWHPA